jgi:hypothetical protein
VDAVGGVRLQRGANVNSRVSSRESVQLDKGSRAQSAFAPVVFTSGYDGKPAEEAPSKETIESDDAGLRKLPTASLLTADTILIRGDLELKTGSVVRRSLVVHGTLHTEAECWFLGDVKAGEIALGPRNRVSRNLVSGSRLSVGEGSCIGMTVVAEGDIALASGTRVGRPGSLTAVAAGHDICLESDVAVWGKIAAGRMVAAI